MPASLRILWSNAGASRCAAGLFCLAFLVNCHALIGGGDSEPTVEATYPLAVLALDTTGAPVGDALVTIDDKSAQTAADGWAHLLVKAGNRIVGRIEKAGFVNGVVVASVNAAVDGWTQSTMLRQEPPQMIMAELGGTVKFSDRELLFPPNAVVDGQGRLVGGEFQVQATGYSVEKTLRGLSPVWPLVGDAAPPPLGIIAEVGPLQGLESYGMSDIVLEQDGQRLQIAPGKQVRLRTLLQPAVADRFTVDAPDASIPSWYFVPETAIWKQDGAGTVRQDELGRKTMEQELSHLTTWNSDASWPAAQDDCVVVTVVNAATGAPLANASVTGSGGAYAYSTSLDTDATGAICLDIKAGGTLMLSATLPGYHLVAQQATSGSGTAGTICVTEQLPFCAHVTLELCPDGSTCSGCPSGTTDCGLMCLDTRSDPKNCGACGNDCSAALGGGGVCVSGSCTCASSLTRCQNGSSYSCANLQNNSQHCGTCDVSCLSAKPGSACMGGMCKCAMPYIECSVLGTPTCVDPKTDEHCGGCAACAVGSSCVSGTCQMLWSSKLMPGINLRAVHCAGPEDCWTVGDKRAIYSYDALANNWLMLSPGMPKATDLYSVRMDNKLDVLMGSLNGDLLHYAKPLMMTMPTFFDEDSTGSGTVYAIGGWRSDHLYAVTDVGQVVNYNAAWMPIFTGGPPLYAVWVLQTMTGDEVFAVGSRNTVLHKPAGSMTFELLHAVGHSGTVPLRAIRGFDAKNLLVAGDSGTLMATTDGGRTWHDVPIADAMGNPITAGFTGLWSYGVDVFLISDAGHIFHSRDAGATFQLESARSEVLNAIGGADLTRIIVVGQEIIHTR